MSRIVLLVLLLFFGALEPARASSISGRVLTDRNRPLANASVNLRAAGVQGAGAGRSTLTDQEGRFQFTRLVSGAFVINVTSPGYVSDSALGGDSERYYYAGDDVTIRMVKGGVITGRVLGANNEPLVSVRVFAQRVRDLEGHPVRGAAREYGDKTDDRGVYRIYGLLPGTYVIGAGGKQERASLTEYDRDAPTYYPSSRRANATEVNVRLGEEASGIDIRYRRVPGHSIVGSVAGGAAAGARFSNIVVSLIEAGSEIKLASYFINRFSESTAFNFHGLADGDYLLIAEREGEDGAGATQPQRVKIKGADISGVVLSLAPLASIAGRVEKELNASCREAKRVKFSETVIKARSLNDLGFKSQIFRSLNEQKEDEQGEFQFNNLIAGYYRFDTLLPDDYLYVRSITLAGRPPLDLAREGLLVRSGESLKGVTIRIAEGGASLRGLVISAQAGVALPTRLRVYLIPVEKTLADNLLRYGEALVKSDGSIKITNIAPGRYWVKAVAIAPEEVIDEQSKPIYWDVVERLKLRKAAEKTATLIELHPCQQVTDFVLNF